MKLKTLCLAMLLASPGLMAANLSISTTTNSRNFPLPENEPLVVPLTKDTYILKVSDIDGDCQAPDNQKVRFSKPLSLNCGSPTELPLKIRFSGDYAFDYDATAHTLSIKRAPKKAAKTEFKRPVPRVQCETQNSDSVTISLGDTYPDNTKLRDAFTGKTVVVKSGQVSVSPSKDSGGLVLLEPADKAQKKADLNWKNANIYFVMVDRFNNADHSNDNRYGRHKDGKDDVGTFHGGDLKGVIEKLDYIKSLGTDAIWLSPIVEQMHGFVGGGESGSFPFYGYHGYWTRDFTKIDENFGTETDLKKLVKEAHKRGIKILMDAVINHSGYSSLADLQFDGIDVVTPGSDWPEKWADWTPKAGQNWHSFHSKINYQSKEWKNWWGGDWVRSGLPGYPQPGSSDITMSLAGLPDFLTESDKAVTPPKWLLNNPGTHVQARDNYRVSDYLIEWQTGWVKRFGIDGYRVDTVKHVEGEVWKRLKAEATSSLEQWRKANNQTGQPFFMMGEVWGHSAYRSPYFDDGFDALINFDMQKKMDKGAACFSQMADTYQNYANTIQTEKDFNPVSYMSSHDTELFFSRFKSMDMQKAAANALLLSPGAVQVYYGDEVARKIGPYADDFHQGTRSDMLWKLDKPREQLLKHWQTVGQFRKAHPAIGAGKHEVIPQDNAYVFSRELDNDKVVVAFVGK
ncbi:alpha-amylase [Vibrio albus]|uniref:Alpha-amylase n=1 Tax=Vibrio albus TaxID=2200953 RepID=A0A2U3B9D4_9VIBR|nr:alpha-amylase [Vibrio albus]PWI33381.1 alpha-amylase [Vibrio albus]